MIPFLGKKRVETSLGMAADFCPICRDLRAFEVFRAGMAGHVYGITAGSGQFLGHVKQCKSCGLKLGADPDQYTGFDKTTTNLDVLVARTFPGIWMKYADRLALEEELRRHPGALAPETRQGYLMEPFVLFNSSIDQCLAGKAPLDLPCKLSALGTLLPTGALLSLAVIVNDETTKDHLFAAMLAVLGLGTAFTLWQLYLRPGRYIRNKVLPFLALALRPLVPTHAELDACLEKCRTMRMKIGHAVTPDRLWTELANPRLILQSQRPAPGKPAANSPTGTSPADAHDTPPAPSTPPPLSAPVRSPQPGLSILLPVLGILLLGGLTLAAILFVRLHHVAKTRPQILIQTSSSATPPLNVSERPLSLSTAKTNAASPDLLTNATNWLIPAPICADMIADAKRGLLYISAGGSVLRYHLASHSFLSPLELGGRLRAMDLSMDGDWLAVAAAASDNGLLGIHLVDLEKGAQSKVTFSAEPNETGTASLVFGADGSIWVTTTADNLDTTTPLRKYLPATRQIVEVARVGAATRLAVSANHEYIGYASPNLAGNYDWFRCRTGKLQPSLQAHVRLSDIGISRDGIQLTLLNLRNVLLSGASLNSLEERNSFGAVFHPRRDYLFLSRSGKSDIEVLETTNYTLVKDLEMGAKLVRNASQVDNGRLRLSSDGKYLFCIVSGGIYCMETGLGAAK